LRRRLHVSWRGDFAAVVNDYGRHGQVLDLRSGRVTMMLDGGDYHPETVPFSLAFFEARGRPVVIHRSDWNRLDLSDPAIFNAVEGTMQLTAPNRAQFASGGRIIATLARFPGPKHFWLCD